MKLSVPSHLKKPGLASYRETARLRLENLAGLPLADVAADRPSEDEWFRDFYRASLQVRDCLELSARITEKRQLSVKNQGILIGHIVRLYKLYDTFLLLVSQARTEVAWMLVRPMVETGIHLEFLIVHGDEQVFDSYQRASLAHDKKTLTKSGSYQEGPYDKALQGEILAGFQRSGVALDDVGEETWGGERFGNTYKKAKAVGSEFEYDLGFRYSSQLLHGTWYDLEHFHLIRGPDGYRPKLGYRQPTTGLLPGASAYCIKVAIKYAIFMWAAKRNPLSLAFVRLGGWFHTMLEAHERFVAQAKKRRVN